ncbi:integrase arm-type DNA-binding domain-containing protein [Novosphingobium sp.]|uniref:integrase arm-type DNA-binding domain-containing protein n=1 Tax=Novosphingobium sp. TaxID=1874826 RepID=UPI0025D1AD58|nr:integrase arm-type DNA-binding domain-containing protein [Novosphingobium sp.]
MSLNVQEIKGFRAADKSYKKYDSRGLLLLVKPNGSKLWYFKYRFGGKEKKLPIGAFPEVSLSQARELRDRARLKVSDGIDPMLERKRKKARIKLGAENIPYYRGQDVTGRFFIDSASPNFITEDAFNRQYMKRSHLKKGDVLLSIIGTIGELSLVDSENDATCSCKLAIFRPHSIEPEFLAAFLQSVHGNNQIRRLTRGAVQQSFLLEDVNQLLIPEFSDDFRNAVVEAVQAARVPVVSGKAQCGMQRTRGSESRTSSIGAGCLRLVMCGTVTSAQHRRRAKPR